VLHCAKLERELVNEFAKSCPRLKSIEIISSAVFQNALCMPTADRCVSNSTAA